MTAAGDLQATSSIQTVLAHFAKHPCAEQAQSSVAAAAEAPGAYAVRPCSWTVQLTQRDNSKQLVVHTILSCPSSCMQLLMPFIRTLPLQPHCGLCTVHDSSSC